IGKPVKVRLTVYDAPQFIMPASSLRFTYQPGDPEPKPQTAYVTASGHAVSLSVAVTGGNWLEVSPRSGNTPIELNVKVHPSGLDMGLYSGSITVSSPDVAHSLTMPVTLMVNGLPPAVAEEDVLNGASLACANIAPGEILQINGKHLTDE